MADQWTIVEADNDTVTVSVAISDVEYRWTLAYSDVDITSEQDLLNSLRDFATAQREALVLSQTAPVVVSSVVGHIEEF
jgi:hypothetical protein